MLDFKFVCSLVIWYDILYEINISSKSFQEKDINLQKSIEQFNVTKTMLQNYRTDEGFAKSITTAKSLAEELGIEWNFPQEIQIRTRRKKKEFDYEVLDDPILNPEKNFRVNFLTRYWYNNSTSEWSIFTVIISQLVIWIFVCH